MDSRTRRFREDSGQQAHPGSYRGAQAPYPRPAPPPPSPPPVMGLLQRRWPSGQLPIWQGGCGCIISHSHPVSLFCRQGQAHLIFKTFKKVKHTLESSSVNFHTLSTPRSRADALAQQDPSAPSNRSPDIGEPVPLCLLRADPLPNFTPLEAPHPPEAELEASAMGPCPSLWPSSHFSSPCLLESHPSPSLIPAVPWALGCSTDYICSSMARGSWKAGSS